MDYKLLCRSKCTLCSCYVQVTPCGVTQFVQNWFSYWLVAWGHRAITWTNVDLSSMWCFGIHMTCHLMLMNGITIQKYVLLWICSKKILPSIISSQYLSQTSELLVHFGCKLMISRFHYAKNYDVLTTLMRKPEFNLKCLIKWKS